MKNSVEVLKSTCKTTMLCSILSDGRRIQLVIFDNTDKWEYEFGVEEIFDEGKRGRVQLVVLGSVN